MTDVNLSRLVGQLDAEQIEELQAGIERRLSFLDGQEIASRVAAGYKGKVHWLAKRGACQAFCGNEMNERIFGSAALEHVTCNTCLAATTAQALVRMRSKCFACKDSGVLTYRDAVAYEAPEALEIRNSEGPFPLGHQRLQFPCPLCAE